MTAPRSGTLRSPTVVVLAVALAATLGFLLLAPEAAGAGWRAALLAGSAAPVGAVVLLLVARVTGADWDAALKPLLAGLVLLPPAALGVVLDQQAFHAPPAHLALYLGWPAYALRALLAVGLWCGMGVLLARGRVSPLIAGLGLVAHGVIVSLIAVDWILGVEPGQPSSGFGMALGVAQILGGGAAAALLGRGPERALKDLSRLAIAAALGLSYLLFVDYLVVWFGDLPARVGWYALRTEGFWGPWPVAALALGLFGAIACVASTPAVRRLGGALGLAGVVLALSWLVLPPAGLLAAPAALAALILFAATGLLAARRLPHG